MKKHISVVLLFARSTIFPILALLAAMAAVELALFRHELNVHLRSFANGDNFDSLEQIVDYSSILLIFGAAFLLMTVILCLPGCRFGSRTDYTVGRLSLDERTIYWWQVGYNAACYVILWAVQLGVALICCALYVDAAPATSVTGQTVFLAFYRSPLLHALLPLEEVLLWLRNLAFLAGLALSTARVPVCRRQGKAAVAVIPMVLTMAFFPRAVGDYGYDALILWPTVSVIAGVLWAVLQKEEDDEAA